QHIYCLGFKHVSEGCQMTDIFSTGDVYGGWGVLADKTEPVTIGGDDRFFKPCHPLRCETMRHVQCFPDGIGTVGIHKQLNLLTNGFTCVCDTVQVVLWLATNFYLYMFEAILRPVRQLLLQLWFCVRSKSAAAIHTGAFVRLA